MIPGFIVFFQKKILRLHKVFSDQIIPISNNYLSELKKTRPSSKTSCGFRWQKCVTTAHVARIPQTTAHIDSAFESSSDRILILSRFVMLLGKSQIAAAALPL